jgi:hypothetical protein
MSISIESLEIIQGLLQEKLSASSPSGCKYSLSDALWEVDCELRELKCSKQVTSSSDGERSTIEDNTAIHDIGNGESDYMLCPPSQEERRVTGKILKRVWNCCDPSGDYTITEEEIINRYYNKWKERISCPAKKEKYTYAECVLDFIAIYWAYLA